MYKYWDKKLHTLQQKRDKRPERRLKLKAALLVSFVKTYHYVFFHFEWSLLFKRITHNQKSKK